MSDYSIGKGKVLFKLDGTNGFLDLGNCPDFKISMAVDKLEHFSSRSGLNVKDAEVITKQTGAGAFTLDEPNINNLNLFAMGNTVTDVSQTGSTVTDEAVVAYLDKWVPLAKKKLSAVAVKHTSGTPTYVLNTDYELDAEAGLIRAKTGGAITDAQSLKVDYTYATLTIKRVDSSTKSQLKGHIWFVGNPPAGRIQDVKGYVNLMPEGDMPMIGEEWRSFGFKFEFIDDTTYTGVFEILDRGTV